ncbi:MAG TPA: hypothetical protein GXZ74_07310 [Tissierellia bacterium]|nr:hypothetical protein [Tissierellia bacterium]
MASVVRTLEEHIRDLYRSCPDLSAGEVLRSALDSDQIFDPALAEANRFSLVRLADDWPLAAVRQLIRLFCDALKNPSGLLRFHYAQAIGELTGRHDLPLIEQAKLFIEPEPQETDLGLRAYFGYFLNGYQRERRDIDQLLALERHLRSLDQSSWVSLVFQLPQDALNNEQYRIARSIQSLDGLRLLQRFYQSGFPLPEAKPSRSVLVQYERLAPSQERDRFVESVKSTTELMIGSLTDTAPEGLKHSTIEFLSERARLLPAKRAYNTLMHLVQLMKLDRDIAAGLHARDQAIELLRLLTPAEVDRLVIELRNSLGVSASAHIPAIPKLLSEALIRSPAKRWTQVIDYLHELIKVGNPLQSVQAIQTIYYLIARSGSVELQSILLLCLLSGAAHHRDDLAVLSLTTIAQLLWDRRLVSEALGPILPKLLFTLEHRFTTSTRLAYFYQPIRRILSETIDERTELRDQSRRPAAFFPGSFDPFSLGHEAVARAVAALGYDVYLAIDEFSWSKRTQPNRIRREIMRLSIADELHLYEFPETISINIANDKDLRELQSLLGEDVSLIVGEDVIRGASAYRQAKLIRRFHHLVFARSESSDIEAVAAKLGLSIERIPLKGYEAISSSLIRSGLGSRRDISQLIDPLARRFIYEHDAYQDHQLTKDALVLSDDHLKPVISLGSHKLHDPISGAKIHFHCDETTLRIDQLEGDFFHLVCDVLAEAARQGIARATTSTDYPELRMIGFLDNQVDLRTPCSLHFDLDDLIKDGYRQDERFLRTLHETRQKLLLEIGRLYPGHFILPLYQHRVYQRLAQLITQKNGVELTPTDPKRLGPYLAVPFGEILKKRVLPNTVTKSLHTEKYFASDLSRWQIEESPDYMALENQVRMIESFDRPILLVDDLLNKGYRLRRLMPLMQEMRLGVDTLYVGLISQQGRAIARSYDLEVQAAYELPRLRHWFAESKLYPYLGGDSVYHVSSGISPAFWPSINLIYPYNRIPFLSQIPIEAQYSFSRACLDHAISLLEVLEELYQHQTDRYPQLRHLPEWVSLPRHPYYGRGIVPEESRKPSQLLRQDREWLDRIKK